MRVRTWETELTRLQQARVDSLTNQELGVYLRDAYERSLIGKQPQDLELLKRLVSIYCVGAGTEVRHQL
jgi:hypothetical protein